MKYITALHGNEIIPTIALADQGISQIVGNPLAITQNVRYIDTDLNASFGVIGKGNEISRANYILSQIPPDEQVLDFHTTSANTKPFVIIVDLAQIDLARKTGFKHIVYMKYNPKLGHSLIDHRPGISLEVGDHQSFDSYVQTLNVIKNVNRNKCYPATLYEVFDVISEPGDYQNFIMHSQGFIPVLAGSKAYKFFGFKSRIINY